MSHDTECNYSYYFSSMYQKPLLLDTQPNSSTTMKEMKEVIISETHLLMKMDAVQAFGEWDSAINFP